jgi:predicted dehydrogenase
MDTSTVSVGLIGAGFMGREHARLVSANPDTTLVGVADPYSDRVAGAFGVPSFSDHRALLDSGLANAVIVASPNSMHVDTAIDCLESGVAVFVEKPMATTQADALRLVQAVERTSGRLLVGHQRRHHPSIAAARSAIAAGRLGRLVALSGLWAARKHDAYFDEEWRRLAGGGVMFINLVHDLDLLRHLVGEVTEVQAMTSSSTRGLVVEDTASFNLRFESGAIGSFAGTDAGASPWGWDQSSNEDFQLPYERDSAAYFLTGTAGALSIPDLALFSYPGEQEGEWRQPLSRTFLPMGVGDSYTRQLAHFVEVARGLAEPIVAAADAARTVALVEAAHLAAETGETVAVGR